MLRDSEQTVTVRWYRCAPGAPELGVPCFLRSLHWEAHPYEFNGVGEVFNTVTDIYPYRPIPGADGKRRCGTDRDFAEGGQYQPTVPPAVRSPEGLLECCHSPPGGVVVGNGIDLAGVLLGGGSVPTAEPTVATCADPGAAHILADGFPQLLYLGPGYPTSSTMFAYLADFGSGNVRVEYQGFTEGTVTVFTLVHPSFCILSAILYSGPADGSFTIETNVPNNRDLCITVSAASGRPGPVQVTVTPLP